MNLEKLSAIFYKHDPAGLSFADVPKDEYKPEAIMVLPRLTDFDNVKDLSDYLCQVFVEMFGVEVLGSKRGQYDKLAKEILEYQECKLCDDLGELDTPDGTMKCGCDV